MDAVALGIARRKLATTALLEVKRALEAQKDYPVMVAVDEFSEWCVAWWLGFGVPKHPETTIRSDQYAYTLHPPSNT